VSYIAVIDYEIGNIRSILNALEQFGKAARLTRDRSEILGAEGVILPGVGAFSHGMEKLKEHGLVDVIHDYVKTSKPLMGICLGMQLLFDSSEEFGHCNGLGLIPGEVVKLETFNMQFEKLPHVSWNEIAEPNGHSWKGTILNNIKPNTDMYFVHSYAAKPNDSSHVLSTTEYSENTFCSSVHKDNIYGCQFHPEKSATEGLKIIKNFIELCKE
jgi:glutamine amidotransferase